MSESRKYNTDALFIFPLIADGAQDFVTDYTPATGDAKVWTDKLISTNPTALILGFDSLSELPVNSDQLNENGAGTAGGVVAFTVIVSGTVGGGDAAGFFFMRSVAGQAWSNDDQIDIAGGTENIATVDSTTYDLAVTAGLIGEIGNGLFAAALSQAEMSCTQGELHIVDSATKAIEDQAIQFTTFGNASALIAIDFDTATFGLKEQGDALTPTATTLTLKSGSLAEPGDVVHILSSGNGVQGTRIINSFVGGAEVATFAAVWETTPTTPITYALFASPLAETVTVGSMDTDVMDNVAMAASMVTEILDALLIKVIEGTVTFQESMALQNAAAAGKLSGGASATNILRDLADTLDRITATVDSDGNRTAITTDLTDL